MPEFDKLTLGQIRELRNLSPRLHGFEVTMFYGKATMDYNLYIIHHGVYEWCITPNGETYGKALD